MQPDVTVDVADLIAVVEIHRPPNDFFDADLVGALADAVESAEANTDVRAIVLCSEGKNFCAGAALGSGDDDPSRTPLAVYRQGLRLFTGTRPIVAAVPGCGGRGRARAGAGRRLPGGDAGEPVPLQLLAARLPPRVRRDGDAAGGRRPAAGARAALHRWAGPGGRRAAARPVRPDRPAVGPTSRGPRPGRRVSRPAGRSPSSRFAGRCGATSSNGCARRWNGRARPRTSCGQPTTSPKVSGRWPSAGRRGSSGADWPGERVGAIRADRCRWS